VGGQYVSTAAYMGQKKAKKGRFGGSAGRRVGTGVAHKGRSGSQHRKLQEKKFLRPAAQKKTNVKSKPFVPKGTSRQKHRGVSMKKKDEVFPKHNKKVTSCQ